MKVNVGKQTGKKFRHKLPSQTETTSQFGFYQPCYFRECAAQDTVSIRTAAAVRLQPVAKPTFGRLFLKQYTNFVSMEDVWHPWASFLAGKPYNGAYAQYIPQESPVVPLGFWNLMCMCLSNITFHECTSYVPDAVGSGYTIKGLHIDSNFTPEDSNVDDFYYALIDATCGTSFALELRDYLVQFLTTYDMKVFYDLQRSSTDSYDWIFPFSSDIGGVETTLVATGRFSEAGKNLRKIVIGLGAQLNFDHTEYDFMRFVAYYKTWFDMFAVQREITWKQTNAFSLMEYVEQTGRSLSDILRNPGTMSRPISALLHFVLQDLPMCYYTSNPDYISAHIVGTAISQSESIFNYLDEGGDGMEASSLEHEQPFIIPGSGANSGLNQQGLDILKKLYQYTNIATAVGGKIRDFMRAIFGSDYKDEQISNFIGSNTMELNITDVMSTAETSEGFLGEYAGQGKGADGGQNLKFTCSTAGFLITAFCIVPDARFCQGVDPNGFHKEKFDFFTSPFDSLTLLPSRKSIVYGVNDIVPFVKYDGGFGNVPNYMEYKQSFDRLNGDLSMRSTRSGLLPFSMQRLISFGSVYERALQTEGYVDITVQVPKPDLFVAGTIWRFIGLDRWLGNFDRIFVNSGDTADFPGQSFVTDNSDYLYYGRLDDNFVCYFYNDVEVTGFELPVADSFQTDSFGDHLKVEKA